MRDAMATNYRDRLGRLWCVMARPPWVSGPRPWVTHVLVTGG